MDRGATGIPARLAGETPAPPSLLRDSRGRCCVRSRFTQSLDDAIHLRLRHAYGVLVFLEKHKLRCRRLKKGQIQASPDEPECRLAGSP